MFATKARAFWPLPAWGAATLAGAVLAFSLPAAAAGSAGLRAVMITPYGQGTPFSDAAYQGLADAAAGRSLSIRLVEVREPAEYPVQLRALAELGYDVILALHDYFAEDMIASAREYPGVKFVLVDSYAEADLPNFRAVAIESHEGSFLAGVAAAHATESGHVGFIGGLDHPIIIQFLAGFEAGLHYVDPSIRISVAFSGTFDDPVKGREMALDMFRRGADVIMHAADLTGLGVLRAAQETGRFGIGVDVDQSAVAPGHVLASALKDVRGAVYHSVVAIAEGHFEPGLFVFGAGEGARLVAIPEDIPFYRERPGLVALLAEIRAKVQKGEIQVPLSTATR